MPVHKLIVSSIAHFCTYISLFPQVAELARRGLVIPAILRVRCYAVDCDLSRIFWVGKIGLRSPLGSSVYAAACLFTFVG